MHEGSMANIECGSEALSSSDMLRYKSSVLRGKMLGHVEWRLVYSSRNEKNSDGKFPIYRRVVHERVTVFGNAPG